ncbi:hypothetical protein FRC10_000716 [Ceratobasidium sp. 414]|nr:hypothetical protein FRC10_000716 [Ceratobasidium sp. 414]
MRYSAVLATLFAGYVAAQSSASSAAAPTGTGGISACILQCSMQAAQSAGCASFTDPSCVCSNTDFQTAAAECLQANCTAAEQQAALQLQQQLCGASTGSASGSATPTGTSPAASNTATAPASSSSASATSRASASSASHASSTSRSASSAISSASSATPSATRSGNSAVALPILDFAAAGIWAAVAFGGAAAAQLVL